MARIRTIKPEFWTDSLMVQLPHFTRLLYIALWNAADDHGFIRDEPERLAMELMPREQFLDVDASIQVLVASGRLDWFVDDDGESYYRVSQWENHQKVDHPSRSKLFRESSRKVAIPTAVRRGVAAKYGCQPGQSKDASCYYCGTEGLVKWFCLSDGRPSSWVVFPGLELDHLEPEFEGGPNTTENIILSCRRCNRGKGTKHWFDFMASKNFANPLEGSRGLALERKGKERKGTGNTAVAEPAPKPKPSRIPATKPKTDDSIETILQGKDSSTWNGYWDLVKVFGGGPKNPAPRTTARLYTQALLLTSPETIIRKAKGLAGSTSDLKFMPQLATWLEGQGYLNPDVKPRAARLQTFESKTPEADAAFDAQLDGMTFQEIS